jgi:hypothetical protein
VLDHCDDAARHESRRADDLSCAGDLGDLDCSASDQHVDPPPFARRDDLEAADAVTDVDEDFDPIALHRIRARSSLARPSSLSTRIVAETQAAAGTYALSVLGKGSPAAARLGWVTERAEARGRPPPSGDAEGTTCAAEGSRPWYRRAEGAD